jgi:hypothetical protein
MEDDGWLFVTVAIMCAIVGGIIYLAIEEAKQWEAFKIAHHCKITAHIDSEIFTTVGPSSNGGVAVGVGSTSAKTGWLCDDGITYFK